MNNNKMDTNTKKLAKALENEPVEIQEIVLKNIKTILEEYAEDCCSNDIVKIGELDFTDKVDVNLTLPALYKASSYKNYGLRYFAFEANVSTYYGKRFDLVIEVVCDEHINDVFCTTLGGKKVLACNWLSPFKIEITEVNTRKCLSWLINESEKNNVEL